MKKIISSILILLLSIYAFAKNWDIFSDASDESKEVISKAYKQINKGQYLTALSTLATSTDENKDYVLYVRNEIFTQYYAYSIMHQMFSVKDLKKGETLYKVRTSYEGELSFMQFNPEDILSSKENKSPINYLTLAEYYFDVSKRYGNQWLKSYDEVTKLAYENYKKAYDADCYSTDSLGHFGEVLIRLKKFENSAFLYQKLTEKVNNNGNYWYNYTLSLMYLNRYEEAKIVGQNILTYPEDDPAYALEGYTLLADAYSYSNQPDEAMKILKKAQKKFKKNPAPLIHLGEFEYLFNDDKTAALKYFKHALKISNTADTKNSILDIYAQAQNFQDAIEFLQSAVKISKKNTQLCGICYMDMFTIYSYCNLLDDAFNAGMECRKIFADLGDYESVAYVDQEMSKIFQE